MSIDSRINNQLQYFTDDSKFTWPPDINATITEILDINEDDIDEQIIELISIILPNAWLAFSSEWSKVKKYFQFLHLLD